LAHQVINRGLKLARGAPGSPVVGRDSNAAGNIGDGYNVVAGRAKEQHERPWYLQSSKAARDAAERALPRPAPPARQHPRRRRRAAAAAN